MASQARGSAFNLKSDLLRNGHEYSFFQVIRLLRFLKESPPYDKPAGDMQTEYVRLRPELSLAFPAADVARIEEVIGPEEKFQVFTTFLGLYGSSSPLPTFYTEDLFDEAAEDESVSREFIDMVNHRLFLLLFQCWAKYRQYFQIVEECSTQHFERLYCLLGLGEEELRKSIPENYQLLRYVGLFTQFPRSALGMKALIQDILGGINIDIIPCLMRKAVIPMDQRSFLGTSGSSLGDTIFLGEEIDDRMGKFRLQIGPINREEFQGLLPGQDNYRKLTFFIDLFLIEHLEYDFELILFEDEVRPTRLGSPEWSRLGLDTWIFSGDKMGETRAVFQPETKGEK